MRRLRTAWVRFWLHGNLRQLQAVQPAGAPADDPVFQALLAARMAELRCELVLLGEARP